MLEDPELREGIKAFSSWPTIPQVGGARRGAPGWGSRALTLGI